MNFCCFVRTEPTTGISSGEYAILFRNCTISIPYFDEGPSIHEPSLHGNTASLNFRSKPNDNVSNCTLEVIPNVVRARNSEGDEYDFPHFSIEITVEICALNFAMKHVEKLMLKNSNPKKLGEFGIDVDVNREDMELACTGKNIAQFTIKRWFWYE